MQIHSDMSSLLAESRAKSNSLISGSSFASRVQKDHEIYRPKDWWAQLAVGRMGSLPKSVANPTVMYDQLLQLFKGSVFICAGAAADKAASMPANVYRLRYRKSGEYRERVSRNHPCVRLLESPHPRLTSFDMHYQNFGWLQICGDAYMHKQKNAFGIPVRLNPLSPQWVKIIPGEMNFVDGYRVNTLYVGTQNYDIPASEMLHFQKKALDWSNTRRFYGLSTIIAAENTIQLEAEMLQRLRHKFSNLANPGLIFKTKRRLNEAQLKQNLDAIWMQHRLAEHEGKPMLVHDDMELISGADGKSQELDYRGSLEDTLKITSAAFGVPLAIVGLTQDQSKCHDFETECMTDSGWKKYQDISMLDRIGCYDPVADAVVFHHPQSVFVSDYSGKMCHWKSKGIADVLVTPNHRMFCQIGDGSVGREGPWHFEPASDVCKKNKFQIFVAAASGDSSGFSEDFVLRPASHGKTKKEYRENLVIPAELWAKFIGWFVSEGSLASREILQKNKNGKKHKNTWRASILSQKEGKKSEEIQILLNETGLKWHKSKLPGNMIRWTCTDKGLYDHLAENCYTESWKNRQKHRTHNGSLYKKIPEYISRSSIPVMRAFLESAMDGDGHRTVISDGSHGKMAYSTTSIALADGIQLLSIGCGYSASVRACVIRKNKPNSRREYVVSISKTKTKAHLRNSQNFSLVDYKGKVWCVQVPTGMFFVRRNGHVHVSGNSNAEAQMATFAHNKLNPMLMQYSQTLTNQLAKDFEDDLIIEIGPFTVRDYKEIVNGAQALWRAGAITPNEIRDQLLNLPPLDQGGDTPVLPAGVQLATYGNDVDDGKRAAGGDETAGVNPSYLADMWG